MKEEKKAKVRSVNLRAKVRSVNLRVTSRALRRSSSTDTSRWKAKDFSAFFTLYNFFSKNIENDKKGQMMLKKVLKKMV